MSTPKEYQLKHRLTGAVIIVLAGVVLIPMVLQDPVIPPESQTQVKSIDLSEEDTLTYLTNVVKGNAGEVETRPVEQSPEVTVPVESQPAVEATEDSSIPDADRKSALIMTQKSEKLEDGSGSSTAVQADSPDPDESGGNDKEDGAEFDELSTTGWVVRVGTFAEQRYEQQTIENLVKHNLAPKRTQVMTGAGQAVRVWIGPYLTEEEAKRVALALKDITGQEGYVPRQ